MSVYVDPLVTHGTASYHGTGAAQAKRVGEKSGHQWCHLFTDAGNEAELHALAAKIGMKPSWFQGNHYDLTPSRRLRALKEGAIEVDRRQAVLILRPRLAAVLEAAGVERPKSQPAAPARPQLSFAEAFRRGSTEGTK